MQGLLFDSLNQWAAIAVVLIAGWLFGLASAPGNKKWKRALQEEEIAHVQTRDTLERDLRDAEVRVRTAETERDRAHKDLETVRSEAAAIVPVAPVVEETASRRGWFGWGRDNLSRIQGIDDASEARLNAIGIKTYREIEKMSGDEEASLEQRLGLSSGTIAAQGWREQAALLRAGNDEEYTAKYEKPDSGPSLLPLAAAALGGAAVAIATREKEPEPEPEVVAEPEVVEPKAVVESEPTPTVPAEPVPAATREEVKAAEPEPAATFPAPQVPAAAPEPAPAEPVAEPVVVAAEPPVPAPAPLAQSEARPAHEWLPQHVRAPESTLR
jgi:predicted flap endonuclease-1-like 5' DNA nuclease